MAVDSIPLPWTGAAQRTRVRRIVDDHYDVLWRLLARLGVPPDHVEDVAQEVLLVVARRVDDVAIGKERAFVLATAVRAASEARRRRARRPEAPDDDAVLSTIDPTPTPDELLDRRRCRSWLDRLLERLSHEHREVLVLSEHEGLTTAEMAHVLGVPPGTIASRLSRAREIFARHAEELAATMNREGTAPR